MSATAPFSPMSEEIHITDHARDRMLERGCSVDEVEQTLSASESEPGTHSLSV
jgi:hypothetical protein